MTGFGKMVYVLGCVYFSIATYIIVWVKGNNSTNILLLFGCGWLFLVIVFGWNQLRNKRIFKEYKYAFEKLEEQYETRGRIGEMTKEERYLITLGENYIRDGVFGKKKTKEVELIVSRINQFANNQEKGE